jgi:hypothetical protein
MRYSQMSPEERREVLDVPANYPLRVTFLGKVGLLTFDQVAFLRRHGVDFAVDESQVERLLGRKPRGRS